MAAVFASFSFYFASDFYFRIDAKTSEKALFSHRSKKISLPFPYYSSKQKCRRTLISKPCLICPQWKKNLFRICPQWIAMLSLFFLQGLKLYFVLTVMTARLCLFFLRWLQDSVCFVWGDYKILKFISVILKVDNSSRFFLHWNESLTGFV